MHYATSCLPEIFDVLFQDLSCRTRSKWIFCTVIKTYSVQPMPSLFEQHCRNNIQVCKRYGLQIILITILHTILITTIILREFMWFIWGNADWATNRQTKPTHLGCESCSRLLPSTYTTAFTIITQHKSWYSFYRPMISIKGGRLSRPKHCSNSVQQCQRLYITVAVAINITACDETQTGDLSHCS